jgi:glycosyltransferase involved in cell wall biosynthesis
MSVFNCQNFIAKVIESILSHTYKKFILFISNNFSRDRTESIILGYKKRLNHSLFN